MFDFPTYSVADLTAYISALFDADEALQDVWVEGEVSNTVVASSGHWYFTLKDGQAQLRCALWRSYAARQKFRPENGDAVLAHGRVSVYAPRGEYQLYADAVQPAGPGDLYVQLERLKEKLRAEGLFDRPRRALPRFPRRIGVVTSPEAAAFQDVQNVLRRRFLLAHLILSPTPVQGNASPPQIAAAIERLNAHDACDVILLVRGGGSVEDLWAFNDEGVARAVAASRIPVISGVGHETDFTLVDFVSDLRAPTPSAAAEQAAPDIAELRAGLAAARAALDSRMRKRTDGLRSALNGAARTAGASLASAAGVPAAPAGRRPRRTPGTPAEPAPRPTARTAGCPRRCAGGGQPTSYPGARLRYRHAQRQRQARYQRQRAPARRGRRHPAARRQRPRPHCQGGENS